MISTIQRRQAAILLLAVSTLLTGWLIVGSFATYAPGPTPGEMQNIYLIRIVWFGLAIGAIQLAAILILAIGPRSPT